MVLFNNIDWEATVRKTLTSLSIDHDKNVTMWPRDTLFEYLQTMDSLFDNIKEFQELQNFAAKQLLELHDT